MKKIIALIFALFFATVAFAEGEEATFKFELDKSWGDLNQTVKAGETIELITINYAGITAWDVSGLPPELVKEIDENAHTIVICGTVKASVKPGNYEYTVTVKDNNSEEHTLPGVITVEEIPGATWISVIENETQKVTAGNAIQPIVFKLTNAETVVLEQIPPGSFSGTRGTRGTGEDEIAIYTVEGTVDEETLDNKFTIKVIARGPVTNDTAFATVDVKHKPRVTSIYTFENATQTVTAGEAIQPIVFKFEHVDKIEGLTGFPGNDENDYSIETDNENKTITVTGTLKEDSKGPYTVTLSVKGLDNNASAEATINVTPVELKFDLVEGNDNQAVIAGNAIHPIIYQYDHMLSASDGGFPEGLIVEDDKENKRIKISGTVNSELAAQDYAYSFALTDVYGEESTVTGKIKVVKSFEDFPSVQIYKHNGGTLAKINADYSGMETLSIPDPIVADSVEVQRNLTPLTPATTVLPFTLPEGTTLNAKFYYVQKVEQEGCSWIATVKYIGDGELPEANTPYAIMLNKDEPNLKFDMHGKQATVQTGEIADKVDETGNWYFKGLYSYRIWKDSDEGENNEIGLAYGFAGSNESGISKGEFGRIADGADAVPMTSYLRKANADVRLNCSASAPSHVKGIAPYQANYASAKTDVINVRFVEDDENGEEKTTAIGRLDAVTGEFKIDRWYDLKGRRVNNVKRAAKGAYYGKKVLKK